MKGAKSRIAKAGSKMPALLALAFHIPFFSVEGEDKKTVEQVVDFSSIHPFLKPESLMNQGNDTKLAKCLILKAFSNHLSSIGTTISTPVGGAANAPVLKAEDASNLVMANLDSFYERILPYVAVFVAGGLEIVRKNANITCNPLTASPVENASEDYKTCSAFDYMFSNHYEDLVKHLLISSKGQKATPTPTGQDAEIASEAEPPYLDSTLANNIVFNNLREDNIILATLFNSCPAADLVNLVTETNKLPAAEVALNEKICVKVPVTVNSVMANSERPRVIKASSAGLDETAKSFNAAKKLEAFANFANSAPPNLQFGAVPTSSSREREAERRMRIREGLESVRNRRRA